MNERDHVGRPRSFDESETLHAIMTVFWAKGYAATSLSDITAATSLGKGSLYAAFGDKATMYEKAIAHYEALVVDEAATSLRGPGAPRERLTGFLDLPLKAADAKDPRGCFLCNAATDFAAQDEKIRLAVARGLRKLTAAIGDVLDHAFEGARPEAVATGARAAHTLAAYIGLRAMTRTGMRRSELEPVRDEAIRAALAP